MNKISYEMLFVIELRSCRILNLLWRINNEETSDYVSLSN